MFAAMDDVTGQFAEAEGEISAEVEERADDGEETAEEKESAAEFAQGIHRESVEELEEIKEVDEGKEVKEQAERSLAREMLRDGAAGLAGFYRLMRAWKRCGSELHF